MELKLIIDNINLPTESLTNRKNEGLIFIFVVSKMDSVGHWDQWHEQTPQLDSQFPEDRQGVYNIQHLINPVHGT